MISVALAAYKGEKYIAAQIDSILVQLGADDELIVSDDAPGGETERIVMNYAAEDVRVKYYAGEGRGVVANFANAISRCSGDVIFLCDQDDVWLEGKVARVMQAIEGGACLVLHDARETDENLNTVNPSFFEVRQSRPGLIRNFIKNSYMGCCMAFTKELAAKALPFPKDIPMHDQWLGLLAEKYGRVEFINEPLICHRIHGDNVTGGKTSTKNKIIWRINLLKALLLVRK